MVSAVGSKDTRCGLQIITRTIGKSAWGQDNHFFQQERETRVLSPGGTAGRA